MQVAEFIDVSRIGLGLNMEKEVCGIQITGYGGIGISDEKSKMLEDYMGRKQNIQKKTLL